MQHPVHPLDGTWREGRISLVLLRTTAAVILGKLSPFPIPHAPYTDGRHSSSAQELVIPVYEGEVQVLTERSLIPPCP